MNLALVAELDIPDERELRKPDAWFVVRDELIEDYSFGDPEWAKLDEEANTQALLTIKRNLKLDPVRFKALVEKTIVGLIQHAATIGADAAEAFGDLPKFGEEE